MSETRLIFTGIIERLGNCRQTLARNKAPKFDDRSIGKHKEIQMQLLQEASVIILTFSALSALSLAI